MVLCWMSLLVGLFSCLMTIRIKSAVIRKRQQNAQILVNSLVYWHFIWYHNKNSILYLPMHCLKQTVSKKIDESWYITTIQKMFFCSILLYFHNRKSIECWTTIEFLKLKTLILTFYIKKTLIISRYTLTFVGRLWIRDFHWHINLC